jgi:hypothetical protein
MCDHGEYQLLTIRIEKLTVELERVAGQARGLPSYQESLGTHTQIARPGKFKNRLLSRSGGKQSRFSFLNSL